MSGMRLAGMNMKYNLSYDQALDELSAGYAVRPQSFQYSRMFVILDELGFPVIMELDSSNENNMLFHGVYNESSSDTLSKWAVFDALTV